MRPRCSRQRLSIACERRPGSRTKLASIVSKATPASSTPARRSTCQSYLMLWPAFGTAGSVSSAASGAIAGSVSGGRFFTGVGRRQPRRGSPGRSGCGGRTGDTRPRSALAESERPTSSASLRRERGGLGVDRDQRRGAQALRPARGCSSGSSTTLTSGRGGSSSASQSLGGEPAASSGRPGGSSRCGSRRPSLRPRATVLPPRPVPRARPAAARRRRSAAPSFRASEKNSSSVRIRIAGLAVGLLQGEIGQRRARPARRA